ncbi:hypothetical protein N0V94_009253 [Neodidymelliopsis sp. IMI 364377]|nr:hypothetical protein N0V94_009253 [Neodidymelliopsis sp. IMI 364377]
MATSLPIMPSRPSQRPKLTVNTHQPRIFGKAASLRLDSLSAASPTVRNTFNNAYEPTTTTNTSNTLNTYLPPPPGPPAKLRLDITTTSPPLSTAVCSPDSASTASSSTLTSASSESASCTIPYKQPHNLNSILTNSRIVPRKMASSRPMFPAQKQVSFRTPLEEEIKTVRYTWANSDLDSSSSTLSSLESTSTETASTASAQSEASAAPKLQTTRPSLALQPSSQAQQPTTISALQVSPRKSPRAGDKRDSSESEDDSDTCPQTPVAGRRKRSRDWRWTLGKLPGDHASSTASDDESS